MGVLKVWDPVTQQYVDVLGAAGGGGVTDHGHLTGLDDDDHPHYLTVPRADGRYEELGTAASGDAAHVSASDPHTGYQKESEKAAASGYASLDASTKVPIAQVPTGTSGTTVALGNHTHTGTYWKEWTGTQAQYDAIPTKDPDTLYVVVG